MNQRSEHDPRTATASGRPSEPPPVTASLGGPLGIAESAAPPVVFIALYTVSGLEAGTAAWVAASVAGVLALARIVRGQTVQYALSGLIGVAFAAFIVSRTGRPEDFFLPGLLANGLYAIGCTISIAVGWPAVGLATGMLTGEGTKWRADPFRVRLYSRATWMWAGMFALRLCVQVPLYAAGALVALGAARVSMGVPLFALVAWLTWLMLRVDRERSSAEEMPGSDEEAEGADGPS